MRLGCVHLSIFFFFNDTATTEIYTLSLHDALPISGVSSASSLTSAARCSDVKLPTWMRAIWRCSAATYLGCAYPRLATPTPADRKSTRLNSSHVRISYAVFCLKTNKTLVQTARPLT